jgi:hypothetical protein
MGAPASCDPKEIGMNIDTDDVAELAIDIIDLILERKTKPQDFQATMVEEIMALLMALEEHTEGLPPGVLERAQREFKGKAGKTIRELFHVGMIAREVATTGDRPDGDRPDRPNERLCAPNKNGMTAPGGYPASWRTP